MALTSKALLLRLNTMRAEAVKEFASNPYVTIHDYSKSTSAEKKNPFTVWIDLNYPVYVLENNKPVLRQGIKNICIKFNTGYPEQRPSVILPVSIASIHTWNNNTACTHTAYNPITHNLVKEISNIMTLAANCPEGINYNSPTPDHEWLADWTQESLKNCTLPTVPYAQLLMVNRKIRRSMKRL